jgi:hypothetical protein
MLLHVPRQTRYRHEQDGLYERGPRHRCDESPRAIHDVSGKNRAVGFRGRTSLGNPCCAARRGGVPRVGRFHRPVGVRGAPGSGHHGDFVVTRNSARIAAYRAKCCRYAGAAVGRPASSEPRRRIAGSRDARRRIVGGSSARRRWGAALARRRRRAGRRAAALPSARAPRQTGPVMRSRRDRRRPAHALLYYPSARGIVGRPRPSA